MSTACSATTPSWTRLEVAFQVFLQSVPVVTVLSRIIEGARTLNWRPEAACWRSHYPSDGTFVSSRQLTTASGTVRSSTTPILLTEPFAVSRLGSVGCLSSSWGPLCFPPPPTGCHQVMTALTIEHVRSFLDPAAAGELPLPLLARLADPFSPLAGDWTPFIAAIEPDVHWMIASPERKLDSAQGIYVSKVEAPIRVARRKSTDEPCYRTSPSRSSL
jgi:hypothetical protein